jgi:RNA polymerase sigma-70 factor (ECF subfamily)
MEFRPISSTAAIMLSTSIRLVERLRWPEDREAWSRFVGLYTPLLHFWARQLGLQDADASDLVQDVFVLLMRRLPEFTLDPSRSFRGWLRTLLLNRWRDWPRRPPHLPMPEISSPNPTDAIDDAEYRVYLVGRAMELMRSDFQPTTWQACWQCAGQGRPAAEVAAELGISVAAVYNAQARVLRRLRQELQGLLE